MVLGAFGWFWVVLGGFGWFRVLVTTTFLHCDLKNQEIRGANQILSFRWAGQTQTARRGPQNVAVTPKLLQ